MENKMQVFSSEQFGNVRAIMRDGEPWFVAADICKALEIANNRDALTRIDDDEKGVALADTLGGKQEVTTGKKVPRLDMMDDSELPAAISTAVAMCCEQGVDIDDILPYVAA